jgi:hypothetical protein
MYKKNKVEKEKKKKSIITKVKSLLDWDEKKRNSITLSKKNKINY